jgi:hypothetical protein
LKVSLVRRNNGTGKKACHYDFTVTKKHAIMILHLTFNKGGMKRKKCLFQKFFHNKKWDGDGEGI